MMKREPEFARLSPHTDSAMTNTSCSPMEMRIGRDDLLKEMEANGFKLTAEHTFLPHQYFLVFAVK